jgi:FKBP-type peptidyl-prolyl cis-trans isomerase
MTDEKLQEPEAQEPQAEIEPTSSPPLEKLKSAALRNKLLGSKNQTGTIAEALGRRNFLLALVWVGIIALGVIGEQIKTRWEYAQVEGKNKRTPDLQASEQQVVTTASGLKYIDLKIGAGASPQFGDLCVIEYTLKLEDGTVVLSSHDRGQKPLAFPLGTSATRPDVVPPGLDEGLITMRQGGKRRLILSPELGFGDRPLVFSRGNVELGSTLVYDVELVKVSLSPA